MATSLYTPIAPKAPLSTDARGRVSLPVQSKAPISIIAPTPRTVARQPRTYVTLPNPSDAKWKEAEQTIDRLYIDEGLPLTLLRDIMCRLYHFNAPATKYTKGSTSFEARAARKNRVIPKPSPRTRPKQRPKPPPAKIPWDIVRVGYFTFKPSMECLRQYPHQEKILFSLSCYIDKLFDAGGDGWTADLLTFTRRTKSSRWNTLPSWQELSDQTYGASVLIRSGDLENAEITLEKLLAKVRELARYDDPSIFVKFWRICLGVEGIDKRCGLRFNARARFFECLKNVLAGQKGRKHLFATMESLSQVPSPDFRDTLRIGFDKTLRTITSLVGDENAMILHMWTHFFKYWDSQFLVEDTLLCKFQDVWHKIHSQHGMKLHDENAISIHYYYAYAAYYLCKKKLLGENMVIDLFDRTSRFFRMVHEPQWSLTALAFAFSARITASIQRNRGKTESCLEIMNSAIEKLEMGDRECATRAMMLSGMRAKWLKKWGYLEESQLENLRTARIRTIIGK